MSAPPPGGGGFFGRLRRMFRRAPEVVGELPSAPAELGFALVGRAPALFSVFPPRAGSPEDPGEPSQAFCVHLAHAVHRRLADPGGPPVVGLLGAGGAGKSTLFNDLVGAEVSKVDILPHTTLGPVSAVPPDRDVRGLFGPLALDEVARAGTRRGDRARFVVHRVDAATLGDLAGLTLVDLPDLNTQGAVAEGSVTEAVLPWLDAVAVVCSLESFDRTVLDGSLETLRALGAPLALVFNRKGCRGELAPGDRVDLEARARDLGAAGPFFLPDLRQPGHRPDDRGALRAWVAGQAGAGVSPARRRATCEAVVKVGREALARHEARAARAEAVLGRFRGSLKGLRARVELDPLAVFPDEVGHVVRDLRGLLGSPLEWLRRVMRGQGLGTAFARTFHLDSRLKELEAAVDRLRELPAGPYADRLEDHFRMVASSVARAYRGVVADEPELFVEAECRQDLVEAIFAPNRAAAARGFTEYRDQTVAYLDHLREKMLGPGSRVERALAVTVAMFLMVDFFVPGFSFVLYSGGYLVTRTLGSELTGLLAEHRDLRTRQRAELERCWDLLATGLEDHFLRGDRYFGRMDVWTAAQRAGTRGVFERLAALEFADQEAPRE